MKTRIAILFAAFSLLCCSCGGGFKDIKVTSCEVKSLNPTGFSQMEVTLKLGVSNPAAELHLKNLQGTVKYESEPCLTLTTPDIVLEGRTDKVYLIPITGKIDRAFDLLKILSIVRDRSAMERATLDIEGRAELSSGIGKDIAKKDIPLKDLIDKL